MKNEEVSCKKLGGIKYYIKIVDDILKQVYDIMKIIWYNIR